MTKFPFRIYGKKRGDRRTGSQSWANAGEALFFAVFLVLGLGSLGWLLARWVIPEWQVFHGFLETRCHVFNQTEDKEDGLKIITADSNGTEVFRPQVHIRYQVNGQKYDTWTYGIVDDYYAQLEAAQAKLDQFQPGQEYLCWYNPVHPETAVVIRGLSWWLWVVGLVPLSFIIIGGVGLVWTLFQWGKSAEHRSAAESRVAAMNPLQPLSGWADRDYPTLPGAVNLTNSPGTTLAYRLPIHASSTWRVFAIGTAAVIWNGLVIAFLVLFATNRLAADPAWPCWIFLAIAIPIGWWLVYFFVRNLLLASGVGPTLLEISDHPLVPAKPFEIFLSQTGTLSLKSMELLIVCDEEATYRQGTDTRTEHRRVYSEQIWRREKLNIEQGMHFEVRCPVHLPEGVMHSFKGTFNEVQWKLIVRGQPTDWPSFERVFPIILFPAAGEVGQ